MKSIFCILMAALMLVLVIAQYACADGKKIPPTLYRINDDGQARRWAEILGFEQPLENLKVIQSYDIFTELIHDYQPDFMSVLTWQDETPKALYRAGLIAPFTPTETMLAEISEMTPIVQKLIQNELILEDGRMLGYPLSGYSMCEPSFIGYWIMDAWEASPFQNDPYPSSYEELLDFMDTYLQTSHEGFLFCFCDHQNKGTFLNDLFLEPLLGSWVVQCEYAGKPVVFSDPLFITLADRSQELFQRMLKSDYRTKRDTKKQYLFSKNHRGFSCNLRDGFTCESMIPYRTTSDQPRLVNFTMGLYCVNAQSAYVSQTAELFETAIPHTEVIRGITRYDPWAFPDQFDVEATNHELKKMKAPGCYQYTKEWLQSIKDLDQYVIPCLEKGNWIIGSQYSEYMRARDLFFMKGEMIAEEFARELDREWANAIHGVNDKTILIEEFDDE